MRTLILWIATAGAVAARDQDPPSITPEEFRTLQSQLRKREKWETVPWRVDALEARAAAVKEGKPIFIWAMDGQTLGCT